MNIKILISITLLTLIFSCKFKEKTIVENSKTKIKKQYNMIDRLDTLQNQNIRFFRDSILKDRYGVIDNYFKIYKTDTCRGSYLKIPELKEEFEGIRVIHGIRNFKSKDTIFIMPRFNNCEAGTYCFFDITLPPLFTDSYCCHPDNIFVVEDIDEDGIREIGIFYSSCSSRYKSLIIYSLKLNNWNEIGNSDFDVLTQDPTKVKFETLVRKITKNKFKICNFIEGQTKWEMITMK